MMSILFVTPSSFEAVSASAQPTIVRKELYKANIGTQPDLSRPRARDRSSAEADGGTASYLCSVVTCMSWKAQSSFRLERKNADH